MTCKTDTIGRGDPRSATAKQPECALGGRGGVRLMCRSCGYEADDPVVPPTFCPRCHGSTWERASRPRPVAPRPGSS
jgi:hypothetical protein